MQPYYSEAGITIYHADCRDVLPSLPKVDLVLTDPPYGVTGYDWDCSMDWQQWWSLIEPVCGGRVVCTASLPFTIDLINSNRKAFRYWWQWNKGKAGNFVIAKHQPLRTTEQVLVFQDGAYYPQMRATRPDNVRPRGVTSTASSIVSLKSGKCISRPEHNEGERWPIDLIEIKSTGAECNQLNRDHPTQKPVALFSYLIATYSGVGQAVLDPFMGSGTTLRAAKDLGRKAIGIEIEERYCEIAAKRLRQEVLSFAEPITIKEAGLRHVNLP